MSCALIFTDCVGRTPAGSLRSDSSPFLFPLGAAPPAAEHSGPGARLLGFPRSRARWASSVGTSCSIRPRFDRLGAGFAPHPKPDRSGGVRLSRKTRSPGRMETHQGSDRGFPSIMSGDGTTQPPPSGPAHFERQSEGYSEPNQPGKDVFWGETFRGWLP